MGILSFKNKVALHCCSLILLWGLSTKGILILNENMHTCCNLQALTSHWQLVELPSLTYMSLCRKALMRCNWNSGDAMAISSLFEVSEVWVSVHSLLFFSFFFPPFFFLPFFIPFQFCMYLNVWLEESQMAELDKHILLGIRNVLNPSGGIRQLPDVAWNSSLNVKGLFLQTHASPP